MTAELKESAYLKAGAPKNCFLLNCRKPFNGAAIHGRDGGYYCSENCVESGRAGVALIEYLRPKAITIPIATRKRISNGLELEHGTAPFGESKSDVTGDSDRDDFVLRYAVVNLRVEFLHKKLYHEKICHRFQWEHRY